MDFWGVREAECLSIAKEVSLGGGCSCSENTSMMVAL